MISRALYIYIWSKVVLLKCIMPKFGIPLVLSTIVKKETSIRPR